MVIALGADNWVFWVALLASLRALQTLLARIVVA